MSDHGAAPDPVDKAYVQSEALLDDEAARAARRARVLGAVAREPAAGQPGAEPARRPSPWRRGGWLAAASVAVFCAFLAARTYLPVRDQPPVAGRAPALVAPANRADEGSPVAAAKAPAPAPEPAPRAVARAPTPAPSEVPPAAPAAQIARAGPAPEASAPPSPPAPPPPPPLAVPAPPMNALNEVVVTGSRITRRDVSAASPARATRLSAPPIPPEIADRGARLRAAAAAGRTAELESLLARGFPVDIPDLDGTTALMRAIEADQPAAAALLRRHGASLDQRNRAGLSAKDMAVAKDDPALIEAIGMAADSDSPNGPRLGSQ